jgi:hypothetical protein
MLLVACAHEPGAPTAVGPSPMIGQAHQPYRGKPSYLATARDTMYQTRAIDERDASAQAPCVSRSATCDDRLRAVLASIDAQVVALGSPPSPVQVKALELAIIELTPLLTPYPDMTAERNELGALVEKLATLSPAQRERAEKRMTQLTDLMRIQLAAAQ